MIESLTDFKVILVLASQLNNQLSKCFNDEKITNLENKNFEKPKFFKTNLDSSTQLPWTLINHLENNFICKAIDLEVKECCEKTKILPSILVQSNEICNKKITSQDDNKF